MRRRHRRVRGEQAVVNATALTDIALTLLTIFILVAPVMHAGLEVKLPESSSSASAPDKEHLSVTIDPEGRIYLDEDKTPVPDFSAAIATLPSSVPRDQVAVRADKTASYGRVMEVLSELKRAGFESVNLVSVAKKR